MLGWPKIRNQAFARAFLLAAIEEGVPLQVALGKVIRAMGVKECAAKVGMASPNLLRVLNPRHNPTQDTLNRLLKPFRGAITPAQRPSRGVSRFPESGVLTAPLRVALSDMTRATRERDLAVYLNRLRYS